jgi:hypothetical protein
MSYDHYHLTYHLTTDGWIREGAASLPDLIAETWENEVYQGSGFGKESQHWRMLRSSPAFTEEQRAELHQKFPLPGKSPMTDDLFRNLR